MREYSIIISYFKNDKMISDGDGSLSPSFFTSQRIMLWSRWRDGENGVANLF